MNDILTAENLIALKKPFQAREHEFIRGFAYIEETAITDRIESIDPAWSWQIISVTQRGDTVTAIGRMTIKGVSRDGVGMSAIMTTKNGDGEANEAEKAAATDAMKRAARLFGIGRYLLDAPKFNPSKEAKSENVASMHRWLLTLFKSQQDEPQNGNGKVAAPNFPQPPR